MDARVKPGYDGARCTADAQSRRNFSVGRLFELLNRLGQDVRITVKPTKKRQEEMEVVVG